MKAIKFYYDYYFLLVECIVISIFGFLGFLGMYRITNNPFYSLGITILICCIFPCIAKGIVLKREGKHFYKFGGKK